MALGIDFPSWTTVSDVQITGTTPPLSPGAHFVHVETNVGRSPQVLAAKIIVFATPTISDVSPASGPDAGGTLLTITGSGFQNPEDGTPAVQEVRVGGVAATSVVVSSNTVLTCLTPAGTAGAEDVEVDVVETATASGAFTYTAAENPPAVNDASPASGSIAGGYQVILNGADFVGVTAVNVDGVSQAGNYTVNSSTRITIHAMPPHAAGSINIQVVNGNGNDTIAFQYVDPVAAAQPLRARGTFFAGGTSFEVRVRQGFYHIEFVIDDDRELIAAANVTTALQVELIEAIESTRPLLLTGFINAVVPALLAEPGRVTRHDAKTVRIDIANLDYDLPNGSQEGLTLTVPASWIA